ncbi:membrane bound O-acyl transferase family-domain-containing protein [Triangularia verruculosa]|uniref:Membrane bound O-acyl transferase family-domain-containing protein n=1 Tax=Triangularia verruculosa TaxID=2587418 RepID=A0AAN7AY99_9PEZI|nr:membrane bound O-acyl transferase family-domain-containing protein [Triangularia verruculosa]
MDYHPVLDLVAVVTLSSLTVGFVSSSFTRLAVLGLLSTLTYVCVLKCPVYISRSAWATSVGGYTLSYLWQYLDVGILSRWTYEKQGPEHDAIKPWGPIPPKARPDGSVASRLRFGFGTIFSWRFVGTPYQARGLPKLDEKLCKSRSAFLWNTFLTITACYLVLDMMDASADPEVTRRFYTLDKMGFFSRIGDVSAEELTMRLFAALGLGAGLVSVQRGVYSICAFVAVASGVSDPQDWPPFNGPFTGIHNLRSFWSIFWHQTNTHRLRVTSNWLLFDVLRMPKNSKIGTYLRPWLIFLLSAVFHVAIDASAGIPPQDSGAMRFFTIQPLGIVIEDLTTSILSTAPTTGSTSARPTTIQRWVGRLWVVLWMTWKVPAYMFPVLAKTGSGNKGVVPLSLIDLAAKRLR